MPIVILASASKVRKTLLEAAGLPVVVVSSAIDEAELKTSLTHVSDETLACELALAKAEDVLEKNKFPAGHFVVGADQLLVSDRKRFDKPESLNQAAEHLRNLQGKTHELISACTILSPNGKSWQSLTRATLTMRPLDENFIAHYLEQAGETVLTSVGAYRLEGLGAQLFTRIEGDYFTILGLPLLDILNYFRMQKVLPT